MRSASPSRQRPITVTLMAVLTALLGLWDGVVAVLLSRLVTDPGAAGLEEVPDLAVVATVTAAATSVFALILSVALWRGVHSARLLVSLLLLFRVGYVLYLISEVGDGRPARSGLSLVVVAVGLYLVWNKKASEYFERPSESKLAQAMQGDGGEISASRQYALWARDYVVRLAVLWITVVSTPSISLEFWWSLPLAVIMISIASELLRPWLVRIASLFGWLGSLALALFANAVLIGVGLAITPGIEVRSVGSAFLASWIYALAMTVVTWAFSINTQNYLMVHAVRMSQSRRPSDDLPEPGVLFVQLDGVPAPVLEFEIKAGNLPTISRWIRSGSHTWTEWVAQVPSTTPVSQAGLLHGNNTDIPAFRWYEKATGTLMVANHPPDAAVIESRVSDGQGLLADDGVSISNLFSGDAPRSLLTMSGLRDKSSGLGPSQSYSSFFTHPAGFFRALILTVGEMGKEVFQGRRQERLDIQPRIKRHGSYIALRGITNVFLRDLNVALIVEAMMTGAKSIYVDFVDYDEIAHHAGVTRRESMDSLYGLDRVLAGLETLATSGAPPRRYHIVLVSDHGQSQGATFKQRNGASLEELVLSLMQSDEGGVAVTDEVEAWGPVNVLLSQLTDQQSVSGRLTKRALGRAAPALGPNENDIAAAAGTNLEDRPPVVVVGSGNLGGIWFSRLPGRLTLSELERHHPGLVQSLATNPYIGFVVVMTSQGPTAIGRDGTHQLRSGTVTGIDPLLGYGPDAAADFLRAAEFDNAPDIYLNSMYDPVLDEVAAFEELVGCHGGVGGWQTRPILVYPAEWFVDDDLLDDRGRLVGADTVHHQMVRWLERLGHRTGLRDTQISASTRT